MKCEKLQRLLTDYRELKDRPEPYYDAALTDKAWNQLSVAMYAELPILLIQLEKTERERDDARQAGAALEMVRTDLLFRLRRTAQTIVAAIGADGPQNAHEAAERIVAKFESAKTENAALRLRLLSAAGDDLCRLSQEEIKAYSSGAVQIPPKEEFISSCERFHAQIAKESGVLENCLTLAQLIAENQKLTAELAAAKGMIEAVERACFKFMDWPSCEPAVSSILKILHHPTPQQAKSWPKHDWPT